jgi:hypothetical protein
MGASGRRADGSTKLATATTGTIPDGAHYDTILVSDHPRVECRRRLGDSGRSLRMVEWKSDLSYSLRDEIERAPLEPHDPHAPAPFPATSGVVVRTPQLFVGRARAGCCPLLAHRSLPVSGRV